MTEVDGLVDKVEGARREYLALLEGLSEEQGGFKVEEAAWSITEITEHLFLAEFGGINFIWRAADGRARGAPVWSGHAAFPRGDGLSTPESPGSAKPRPPSPEGS